MSKQQQTTHCPHCDALRLENERLVAALQSWDPFWQLRQDLPTPDEALALWRKITSKYPRMRSPSDSETDQSAGMVAAMAFCFSVAKTDTPNSKHDGSWWTNRAEDFSNKARISAPRIRSLLIGIIATNDTPYALSNSDIWLDPWGSRGTVPIDRTAWRALLRGSPIREPVKIEPKVKDDTIGGVRQLNTW